jgi:hypothetical protein
VRLSVLGTSLEYSQVENLILHTGRNHCTAKVAMSDHLEDSQTPFIHGGPYGYFNDSEVQTTVLRGPTQFTIKTAIERIRSTQLGVDLQKQVELCRGCVFGRYGSLQTPTDTLFQYCRPVLERLATQTELRDLSLESFLYAPSYNLELVAQNSSDEVDILGQEDCLFKPAFFISPVPITQAPELPANILTFHASEVQIAPLSTGDSLTSVQGRVSTKDGRSLYFKPRLELREPEFEREVSVLLQIAKVGLRPEIRVPRLEGLVVSGENNEVVMGILMTWIPSPTLGCHLMSKGFWDKLELHQKWEQQIAATVRELHTHGIVWGDVNPMNVVIDENFDAWVIDFGGMNNVDFVDDENRETVRGDWQGVGKLFGQWLPSRAGKLE